MTFREAHRRKKTGIEQLEPRYVLTAINELTTIGLAEPLSRELAPETTFVDSGHLNDDPYVDLVLGSVQGKLELLLGDGTGEFSEAATISGLGQISNVAFGTVHAGGLADLVVNGTTLVSSIRAGSGEGWEIGHQWEASNASIVSLLHLNDDEVLDLVTRLPSQIEVRLGVEDGFSAPVTYEGDRFTDSSTWTDGLAGDLNQDGHVDLVRSAKGITEILLNDGEGVFDEIVTLPNIANPRAIREINGDGQLDLIVATITAGRIATVSRIEFHLGNGDGTFGEATQQFLVGGHPANLSVDDINGDAIPDLLAYERVGVHNVLGSGPSVFLGIGDGRFRNGIRISNEFGSTIGMTAANLTGDARVEIVHSQGNQLLVREVTARGPLSPAILDYELSSSAIVNSLIEDINGDELPDLVASASFDSHVFIRLGTADGFGEEQRVSLNGGANVGNLQLVSADFNGHGANELGVLGTDDFGVYQLWIVNAAVEPPQADLSSSFVATSVAPAVFDVDRNGRPDVVFFGQNQLQFYLNEDNGEWTHHSQLIEEQPFSIQTIDANRDSYLDLVLQGRIYENLSGERFEPWARNPGQFADLNQDGFIDVVVPAADEGESAKLSFSDGDRAWLPAEPIPPGLPPAPQHLVDANTDGLDDFIFATVDETDETPILRVALSDGDGGIAEIVDSSFLSDELYNELVFKDFDGDGILDVAAAGTFSQDVFLGNGAGQFAAPSGLTDPFIVVRRGGSSLMVDVYTSAGVVAYPLPVRGTGFSLKPIFLQSDMDNDGDADVVVSHSSGFISFLGVGAGDLDQNGRLDGSDVDLLRSIQDPTAKELETFDLNGDERVDEQDVSHLVRNLAGTRHGDANFDGRVEFSDFIVLAANFGKENATWSMGDFDGDGLVDFFDFLLIAQNFGFEKN